MSETQSEIPDILLHLFDIEPSEDGRTYTGDDLPRLIQAGLATIRPVYVIKDNGSNVNSDRVKLWLNTILRTHAQHKLTGDLTKQPLLLLDISGDIAGDENDRRKDRSEREHQSYRDDKISSIRREYEAGTYYVFYEEPDTPYMLVGKSNTHLIFTRQATENDAEISEHDNWWEYPVHTAVSLLSGMRGPVLNPFEDGKYNLYDPKDVRRCLRDLRKPGVTSARINEELQIEARFWKHENPQRESV